MTDCWMESCLFNSSPELELYSEHISMDMRTSVWASAAELSHLVELGLGDVDVAVAQLHVHPQALHQRQAVLVVPEILRRTETHIKHNQNEQTN